MTKLAMGALGLCLLWCCGGDEPGSPGPGPGMDGAKELLTSFLEGDADHASLTLALRPAKNDYRAVFDADSAAKAEKGYAPPWDGGLFVIKPNEGQTELLLWSATTEELKAGTGDSSHFPGGWKSAVAHLAPGLTFYRFKFTKPGETLGMADDGLVHVNGRWRIFPKPWRVVQ